MNEFNTNLDNTTSIDTPSVSTHPYIGKRVIIRGDRSGVFFGTLTSKNSTEVELSNCRRLWYWDGAASISQIATDGVTKPQNCKFTVSVSNICILDAIEIIPCTDKACKCIDEVKVWKM